MTVTLFHNPRCSKSRQALAILEEKGITPIIREYLKDVPSADELNEILGMLSMEPRDLMRKKESEYKENGLDNEKLSRGELIQGMVDYPKLIERPIVIKEGKARIGRPPESVLEVLL
jgi:arsenate reductase (glutaredoxin)